MLNQLLHMIDEFRDEATNEPNQENQFVLENFVVEKQKEISGYKTEDECIKKRINRVEVIQKKIQQLNFYLSNINKKDTKYTESLEKEIKTLTSELQTLSPECTFNCYSVTEEEYETFIQKNGGYPIGKITDSELNKMDYLYKDKFVKVVDDISKNVVDQIPDEYKKDPNFESCIDMKKKEDNQQTSNQKARKGQ